MDEGISLEVGVGDHGPILTKTASGQAAKQRLAREADRLARARHPGVVELVSHDPGRLVVTWAGTQTLDLDRPPLLPAAAILAAVALTVADLHDLGLVHGRLDPTHVVIGPDGRPRLCGFGGLGSLDATSTDDVAALGRLIDHLMGTEAEFEPIPERRWGRRRWSGYQRRALQVLADRATDEDLARRPTARALAAAIADAVPEARLETGPRGQTTTDRPVQGQEAVMNERATDPDKLAEHLEPSRPTEPAEPVEPQATFLGLRVAKTEPSEVSHPPRTTQIGAMAPRWARLRRPAVVGAFLGVTLLAAAGWLRPDTIAPDGAWRDSPAQDQPAADQDESSLTAQKRTRPAPVRPATAAPVLSSSSADGSCVPVSGRSADVDGDGCTEAVKVRGTSVSAGGLSYSVGEVGDRVSIGDWDCDGLATPGVVRPSTGEIFLFPAWATAEETTTVDAATIVPGASAIEAAAPGDRCEPPTIRLGDGSSRSFDLSTPPP